MRRRVDFFEDLMKSDKLRPLAKLVYVVAQGAQPQSIAELARRAGADRTATIEACADLVRAGWMKLEKTRTKTVPVATVPPTVDRRRVSRLKQTLAMANYKGECLMKLWLDLLVASDNFYDNARPAFLSNPVSGAPLEFDRYYLEGVAFEFNGAQHFRPTSRYPEEADFRWTKARDLMKLGLSHQKDILLVVVTRTDLSLDGMLAVIPSRLPLSPLDRGSSYLKALESESKIYRLTAESEDRPAERGSKPGSGTASRPEAGG